ncbi:MAG: NrfD/PsrC family molybdoenzyme membrane anchor subunit [Thermodesulfobacteriota bacterium]
MKTNNNGGNPSIRAIGYLVLIVVTAVGLWEIASKFVNGPIDEGTTQLVTWGIWVSGYIFFLGLSAGSFLISTLIYVFGVKQLEEAGPAALVQALGCLLLGGLLIVLDAGHPERMYMVLLYFNPTSVMAYMGLFYNVYIAIVIAEIYLVMRPGFVRNVQSGKRPTWLYRVLSLGSTRLDPKSLIRDRKWLMVLGILGIPAAVIVHGGVGTIFAVAKARTNWLGGLFPLLFIVSALTSGGALLTFLTAAFSKLPRERKVKLVSSLAQLTIGFLLLDALIMFADIFTTSYTAIPTGASTDKLVLYGPYRWIFWIAQVALGLVIPILLVVIPATRKSLGWLGLAGLLVVIGMLGARLTLVIPPQITPLFDMSLGVYNHVRYAYGYSPSVSDVLVILGAFAFGVWMMLGARKYLPMDVEIEQGAQQGGQVTS